MVDVDVKSVDAVWRRGTELQKEIEQSKQKYDELIKQQNNMPGKDKAAEAVIKYYVIHYGQMNTVLR